jgi:nucleolar MIF4G domain-containing protein 1
VTIYSPIFSVMLTLPLLGKISSKPKHLLSRKDVRKQERQAKKQRKAVYHDSKRLGRKTVIDESIRSVPSSPKKRPAAVASEGESATKKRRISLNDATDTSANVPSKLSRTSKLIPADASTKNNPEKSSKRLAPTIDDILPSINLMPEGRDDKEITRLEYLLGLSKKGRKDSIVPNYGAEFADDGLDGVSALLFSSLSNSRLVDPDLLMDADRILAGSVSRFTPVHLPS